MTRNAERPYNELPLLPPEVDYESKAVLKGAIRARAALAALDQAAKRMQNPLVLINSLSLLEAQASSEIENIVTTTDELFRFAEEPIVDAASAETRETLRYRSALFAGLVAIEKRPITVNTAVEICMNIHSRDIGVRRLPGTYIGNPRTRTPIYTPPTGESVILEKLGNWAEFLNTNEDIDPLVVMAIAHYQFEAIHPFEDGNGRTGRILNVLQLVQAGLLNAPILYLSRYIIQNKDEYYRLLLAVTVEGAWEEWIRFLLRGIDETATRTLRKIDRIQDLQEEFRIDIKAHTSAGSNADLLDVLFENPYARINQVVTRCGVSRPTATGWLNALVQRELLFDIKIGRERLFVNTRLMRILAQEEDLPPRPGDERLF
ncbi:Fic family protein [Microbacterium sp. MMO-10]|uniref:Fic family protein n=1 Tax=Microbacterium sp. MMO-10 TaxID=3081272 RepID=UPI0030171434